MTAHTQEEVSYVAELVVGGRKGIGQLGQTRITHRDQRRQSSEENPVNCIPIYSILLTRERKKHEAEVEEMVKESSVLIWCR